MDNIKPLSTVKITQSDENDDSLDGLLLDKDSKRSEILETSPNCRYIKFAEVLDKTLWKTVYRAMDTDLGCEVTWTEILIKALSEKEIFQLTSRVSLNLKLKHKHLISLASTWIKPSQDFLVIISEYVTGGSLYEYLNRLPQAKSRLIKIWGKGILTGLHFLHSQKPEIVHGGLTSKNVKLMSSDGTVKLGNFVLGKFYHKNLALIKDPWYYAPEVLRGVYTQKSDIYSFGMILLELSTQSRPYEECKDFQEVYDSILKRIPPRAIAQVKDKSLQKIIEMCLADQAIRPTAQELLNDCFFYEASLKQPVEILNTENSEVKNISLVIFDSRNRAKSVSFDYDALRDTPEGVALEMVESLHMEKGSAHVVAEEIKKELVKNDLKSTQGVSSDLGFGRLNFYSEDSLVSALDCKTVKGLLIEYFRTGKIDEVGISIEALVRRFQREAGMVSDGKITDNLYRILKCRLVRQG